MTAQPRKVVHADIKPENAPELASRYLDVPNMPWEATKFAGIQIKVLYSDDSGITTALFKLAPGAVVPLHEHTALEQTLCSRARSRITRAYAARVSSSGGRPAISMKRCRRTAPSSSASSSSPTVLPTARSSSPRRGRSSARDESRQRNPGCDDFDTKRVELPGSWKRSEHVCRN